MSTRSAMSQGRTLRALIVDAHQGVFPAVDGGWERIAPWRTGLGGVIAFTGHAFLAVDEDVSDEGLHRLAPGVLWRCARPSRGS